MLQRTSQNTCNVVKCITNEYRILSHRHDRRTPKVDPITEEYTVGLTWWY